MKEAHHARCHHVFMIIPLCTHLKESAVSSLTSHLCFIDEYCMKEEFSAEDTEQFDIDSNECFIPLDDIVFIGWTNGYVWFLFCQNILIAKIVGILWEGVGVVMGLGCCLLCLMPESLYEHAFSNDTEQPFNLVLSHQLKVVYLLCLL